MVSRILYDACYRNDLTAVSELLDLIIAAKKQMICEGGTHLFNAAIHGVEFPLVSPKFAPYWEEAAAATLKRRKQYRLDNWAAGDLDFVTEGAAHDFKKQLIDLAARSPTYTSGCDANTLGCLTFKHRCDYVHILTHTLKIACITSAQMVQMIINKINKLSCFDVIAMDPTILATAIATCVKYFHDRVRPNITDVTKHCASRVHDNTAVKILIESGIFVQPIHLAMAVHEPKLMEYLCKEMDENNARVTGAVPVVMCAATVLHENSVKNARNGVGRDIEKGLRDILRHSDVDADMKCIMGLINIDYDAAAVTNAIKGERRRA